MMISTSQDNLGSSIEASGSSPAHRTATSGSDGTKSIALIMATLNSSLSFYASGVHRGALFPDVLPVSPQEAAEFLKLLEALVSSATVNADAAVMSPSGLASPYRSVARGLRELGQTAATVLLHLLFDGPYNVFETLAAVVCPGRKTYIPADGGERVALMKGDELQAQFCALRIAGLHAIKFIVTICHEHSSAASITVAPDVNPLSSLIHSNTLRTSLFQYLVQTLGSPTAPEELRLGATECMFVLTMRCGLDLALWSTLFEPVLKVIVVESSAPIRAFTLAVLRQYVMANPGGDAVRASIPTLVKLLATDSSYDVKSLCAQCIEAAILYDASSPQGTTGIARQVLSAAEMALVMLDRCVTETRSSSFLSAGIATVAQASDLLEAVAKLLYACLEVAKTCSGGGSAVLQPTPLSSGTPLETALMQQLQRSQGHDIVIKALGASLGFSASATATVARLTRLLIELSAAQAAAGGAGVELASAVLCRLCEATAVGTLIKVLVTSDASSSSSDPSGRTLQRGSAMTADDVDCASGSRQLAASEITISIGLLLLFGPQTRQRFCRELSRYSSWAQGLPRRLHAALQCTTLDCFAELLIVDERGMLVNDPAAVQWDDPSHPTQSSVKCVIDAQELGRRRIVANPGGVAGISQLRKLRDPSAASDARRGYLAFVMVGYIFLTSLTPAEEARQTPAAAGSHHGMSSSPIAIDKSSAATPIAWGADASAALGVALQDHLCTNKAGGRTDSEAAAEEAMVARRAEELLREAAAVAAASEEGSGFFGQQHRRRDPTKFPNPSSSPFQQHAGGTPRTASGRSSHINSNGRNLSQHHSQLLSGLDAVRTEFDAAFSLATELALHYHRNIVPVAAPPQQRFSSTRLPTSCKLQNPYEVVTLHRSSQLRAWTVEDVHEGDLFFLFIPVAALNTSVVGAVAAKARKHHVSARKAFLTTPAAQKRRRWFLLDLHTTIMPRIIALLQTLLKLLVTQGEEHVQVAASMLPSIRASPTNDKAVYGGNLVKVVDYLSHYFSLNVGPGAAAKADREAVAVDPRVLAANEIMAGFGAGPAAGGSPRMARSGGGGVMSPGKLLFEVSSSSSDSPTGSASSGASDLEDRY